MQVLIKGCHPLRACYMPCNAMLHCIHMLHICVIQDFSRHWSIFWYTTWPLAHCSSIKCLSLAPYSFLWFQLLEWVQHLDFLFPGLWSISSAFSWENLKWHKTYDSDNSFYSLKCVWYQGGWNFKIAPFPGNNMTCRT